MKKSHIIILVVALLGGGAYAGLEYWDDIAPLIGMGGPPPVPVRAARPVDTAPVQPAEPTVEEYQDKVGAIFGAIWTHEGEFLYGAVPFGFSANVAKLKITYPQTMKRKNIDLTGKMMWARTDEAIEFFWRTELKGEPVGEIVAGNGDDGQIQDVAARRSYIGRPVAERLWYELSNPMLMLLPVSMFDFKLTKVEPGAEEGIVRLTLEPSQGVSSGFCALRAMIIEVRGEEYELVSYTSKMFIDGRVVTHTTRWEKDGDGYNITIDNGTLELQGERSSEQMVLACTGENPTTYTFSYADSVVTGIAVEMKTDGVDYAIELTDMVPVTEASLQPKVQIGAEFKNPTAAGAWATAKLGWMDPEEAAVPADEAGDEGESGDTTARASAEEGVDTAEGEEAKPAEGEEDPNAEPAQEERQTASAARPGPTGAAARPAARPAPAASEEAEEEEAAPAPARPAARPAATAAPARPAATASAARPASSGTATAVRPASRPAASSAYTLGAKAYREGRHVEAERQLSTAVRQQPGNASAQLMLGEIYYGRGDYGRAQACLSRASQLSSQTWIGARARQLLQRMGYSY